MQAIKEACSSAILFIEAIGIALFGAIAYRNDSLDDWEDYMNLAPPPPSVPVTPAQPGRLATRAGRHS